MARKYTKVERLVEIVRERHNQGETYGEIAASYGLEMKQVKKLMERQRRKERMLAAGYIPQPKGQMCIRDSPYPRRSVRDLDICLTGFSLP